MHEPTTPDEKIEAMEFLLGQALLAIESDNAAIHSQLNRIEAAISQALPSQLAPPDPQGDETDAEPFTLHSLGAWIQFCLERMRAHQSVKTRQMVAIGELTDRVLALGEALTPKPPPPIGPAAQTALEKARQQSQRPPPPPTQAS